MPYLGIKNVSKKWTMPIRGRKQALNKFVIIFGNERVKLKDSYTDNFTPSEKCRLMGNGGTVIHVNVTKLC